MSIEATAPLDRNGMAVIGYAECWNLLGQVPIGRLAFIDAGEIVVLPVNFGLDGHTVVFRTAGGAKLDAAVRERTATFQADQWDPVNRSGWSVLLRGWIEEEIDPVVLRWLENLDIEPWADAIERPRWVRVRPAEVSGRFIPRH